MALFYQEKSYTTAFWYFLAWMSTLRQYKPSKLESLRRQSRKQKKLKMENWNFKHLFLLQTLQFEVAVNLKRFTEGYDVTTFEFPSQKKEGKGGWEPSFASNLILNFRVLIRPYWPGQVQSYIKDLQIDLQYKNQNVRERKALNKG